MRWAVILAGGVGSRFWPASSPARPKQLLPLATATPLLLDALGRIDPLIPPDRVLVVTSAALAPAIAAAIPAVPRAQVLAEPRAASTLPALAWAAAEIARRDPDASMLSLHADWVVKDAAAFRATATVALDAAERLDRLVTVGVKPTRTETGFGYIVPGEQLDPGVHAIGRFVEKPAAGPASELIEAGALWNSGLFAWTVRRLRAEIDAHAPELRAGLPALDGGDAAGFFAALTPVSVDVGVWERTQRGALVAASFDWDDVGSWSALLRVREADAFGNVVVGANAHLAEVSHSVVWNEAGPVVLYGVRDLVVIQSRGITLVTTTGRAPELKKLLDQLPPALAGDRGA